MLPSCALLVFVSQPVDAGSVAGSGAVFGTPAVVATPAVALPAPLVGDRGLHAVEVEAPAGLALSAAACEECHERLVQQWRGSRHAVASRNPTFRATWDGWPNGWCVNCHAPLAAGQRDALGGRARPGAFVRPPDTDGGTLWDEGVTCVVCHLRDGLVLTAAEPTAAAEAAHDLVVDPALATAAACAGCHEFPLQLHSPPDGRFTLGETPAQATVSEWVSSTAADRGDSCQDCHMGRFGHGFVGAHDPALLRDLVEVSVAWEGDGVDVTVAAPGAAHRVPTGDPFRRLRLELCGDDDCADVVDFIELRRVLAPTPTSWELVADRTLPPETASQPSERNVHLDAAGATWWRLSYRFADPRHEAALPPEETGYVVHEAPLPPKPTASDGEPATPTWRR